MLHNKIINSLHNATVNHGDETRACIRYTLALPRLPNMVQAYLVQS